MSRAANRKSLVVADSIKSFLLDHVEKLRSDWYQVCRGFIESYAADPSRPDAHGSVTVTRGVKISAHAHYNHMISRLVAEDGES